MMVSRQYHSFKEAEAEPEADKSVNKHLVKYLLKQRILAS